MEVCGGREVLLGFDVRMRVWLWILYGGRVDGGE